MTRCDLGLILGFLALLTMFSPLLIARWESRRRTIKPDDARGVPSESLAPAAG